MLLGKHDESKSHICDIIEIAKELGGYENLDPAQKQVLINALDESRTVADTGIVRRPMAQVQDTRIVFDRVCREVCPHNVLVKCRHAHCMLSYKIYISAAV